MVLLRATAWLGDAMWTVSERSRAGRDAAPRESGSVQVGMDLHAADDG